MKIIKLQSPIKVRATLLGLLGIISASCTTNRRVDYRNYEKMPSKPSTVALRSLLKTLPYTRDRSFYGNYGGVGCLGGPPTDLMDEYFRRHDVVYSMARARPTMRLADEELVKALKGLNDDSLGESGREYRERAIRFMESPAAEIIGKPVMASLRSKELPGGYFRDPESVRRFFDPSHPGLPGPEMPYFFIKDEPAPDGRFLALKTEPAAIR